MDLAALGVLIRLDGNVDSYFIEDRNGCWAL